MIPDMLPEGLQHPSVVDVDAAGEVFEIKLDADGTPTEWAGVLGTDYDLLGVRKEDGVLVAVVKQRRRFWKRVKQVLTTSLFLMLIGLLTVFVTGYLGWIATPLSVKVLEVVFIAFSTVMWALILGDPLHGRVSS